MSISFVAANSFFNSGSTTSNTFAALNVANGDTIVVGSRTGLSAAPITSVTDTAGNVYRQCGKARDLTELWYVTNAIGNASNVITVTYFTGSGNASGAVAQFRGIATISPLDALDVVFINSGTVITSNAFSTVVANCVMVSYAMINNTGGVWSPHSGWTLATQDGSGVNAIQYKIVSATQSGITTDMTNTLSNDKAMVTASFHETIAGGGGGETSHVF